MVASNLDFTKVDGVDEYIIDFKNMQTVKKDNFNYLYFTNVPQFSRDTDVMRVSLSSVIKDADGNEFSEVITSYISGVWKVPQFTLNTESEDDSNASFFTLEYKDYTEGPGISFIDSYTSPYEQFMRGELFFKWIPETHAIESKVLKCQTIEAENALKLYHTPIPFFYTPKNFGETTIDGIDYWFISWGYSTDSEEFKALVDGQPFEFNDKAFGHKFALKKSGDKWTGNNAHIYVGKVTDVISDYHIGSEAFHNEVKVYFKNDKIMTDWLKVFCGWTESESHTNIAQFIHNKQILTVDFEGSPITLSNPNFSTKSVNSVEYSVLSYSGSHNISHSGTYGNMNYHFAIQDNAFTYTNQARWQASLSETHTGLRTESETDETPENKADGGLFQENIPLVSGLKVDYKFNVTDEENNGLNLYIHKNFFFKINDNNYKEGTNPFAYLASTADYSIIPSPESCSTLMTTYNIQTSGIVIGANIESHAFSINNLGNSVDVIVNDVAILTKQVAKALEDIKKLQEKTNPFTMQNLLFSFAKFGAGRLLGVICAGLQGAFQFGERVAVQAIEESAEMELVSIV